MPIRKLAPLPYPFEQLHGRCAALAERIAQIYVNSLLRKETVIVSGSLLNQTKRPTWSSNYRSKTTSGIKSKENRRTILERK